MVNVDAVEKETFHCLRLSDGKKKHKKRAPGYDHSPFLCNGVEGGMVASFVRSLKKHCCCLAWHCKRVPL